MIADKPQAGNPDQSGDFRCAAPAYPATRRRPAELSRKCIDRARDFIDIADRRAIRCYRALTGGSVPWKSGDRDRPADWGADDLILCIEVRAQAVRAQRFLQPDLLPAPPLRPPRSAVHAGRADRVRPRLRRAAPPGLVDDQRCRSAATAGWFDPPAGLRGADQPASGYPLRGSLKPAGRRPRSATTKPHPQAWAAEQMRLSNEEFLSGKGRIPFLAQSLLAGGVNTNNMAWTTEPVYFLQTPKEVWDDLQRPEWGTPHLLTDQHSEKVNPSPVRRSIGHRNGELVVDTIDLSAHCCDFINVAAPRSCMRRNASGHGRYVVLEAFVKIEDEDTFRRPVYMTKRWRKDSNVWRNDCRAISPFRKTGVEVPQAQRQIFDRWLPPFDMASARWWRGSRSRR